MPTLVELDPMDGRNFPAIERAVHVLRERGLNIEDYEVRLYRESENLIVVFSSPMSSSTMKGSMGKPSFEVELNPKLQTVRSNFAR